MQAFFAIILTFNIMQKWPAGRKDIEELGGPSRSQIQRSESEGQGGSEEGPNRRSEEVGGGQRRSEF